MFGGIISNFWRISTDSVWNVFTLLANSIVIIIFLCVIYFVFQGLEEFVNWWKKKGQTSKGEIGDRTDKNHANKPPFNHFIYYMSVPFVISMLMAYFNFIAIKDPQEQVKVAVNFWAFLATISGAFIIFWFGKISDTRTLQRRKKKMIKEDIREEKHGGIIDKRGANLIGLIFAVIAGTTLARFIDKYTTGIYLGSLQNIFIETFELTHAGQLFINILTAISMICLVGLSVVFLAIYWKKKVSNFKEGKIEFVLTVLYASFPFMVSHIPGLFVYGTSTIFKGKDFGATTDLFYVLAYFGSLFLFQFLWKPIELKFNRLRRFIFGRNESSSRV
jgi:hypothetical protein